MKREKQEREESKGEKIHVEREKKRREKIEVDWQQSTNKVMDEK